MNYFPQKEEERSSSAKRREERGLDPDSGGGDEEQRQEKKTMGRGLLEVHLVHAKGLSGSDFLGEYSTARLPWGRTFIATTTHVLGLAWVRLLMEIDLILPVLVGKIDPCGR
jgi:hypothetical protein